MTSPTKENESLPPLLRIDIMTRMLERGICPFDGQHFSPMLRAACTACNPPKPERKSRYED